MARELRCRPSELLAIEHTVAAYKLDSAVVTFGAALRAKLESAPGKTEKAKEAKQKQIIQRWIPGAKTGAQKFADPASRGATRS